MSIVETTIDKSITIGDSIIYYKKKTDSTGTIYVITDGSDNPITTMEQDGIKYTISSYPTIVSGNTYVGAVINKPESALIEVEGGSKNSKKYKKNNKKSKRKQNKNRNMTFKHLP